VKRLPNALFYKSDLSITNVLRHLRQNEANSVNPEQLQFVSIY